MTNEYICIRSFHDEIDCVDNTAGNSPDFLSIARECQPSRQAKILEELRAERLDEMERMTDTAMFETRSFTAEENRAFSRLEKEVRMIDAEIEKTRSWLEKECVLSELADSAGTRRAAPSDGYELSDSLCRAVGDSTIYDADSDYDRTFVKTTAADISREIKKLSPRVRRELERSGLIKKGS